MPLIEKINADTVDALKSHQELRLSTLRMAKAALKNREIEKRSPLTDVEAVQVLNKLVKQRQDSVEQFTAGGRKDLADKEQAEIEILQGYLQSADAPQPLSPVEIETAIRAAITDTGARGPKEMGAVMKAALGRLQALGRPVDAKLVSETARRLLSSA